MKNIGKKEKKKEKKERDENTKEIHSESFTYSRILGKKKKGGWGTAKGVVPVAHNCTAI